MPPAATPSYPATDRKTMSVWEPMQLRSFTKIMDNLEHILAIELMNAAQGIDFRRPAQTSPFLEKFPASLSQRSTFCERRYRDV